MANITLGLFNITFDSASLAYFVANGVTVGGTQITGAQIRQAIANDAYILTNNIDGTKKSDIIAALLAIGTPTTQETQTGAAMTSYNAMPDWARTYTATDCSDYVKAQVFGGQTIEQVTTYVNTNVTDLASAKVVMIQIATAIINLRTAFSLLAQLVICIRDLVIRYR